MIKASDKEK